MSPSHICPKCRLPQEPEAFINKKGEQKAWCASCRTAYRERMVGQRAQKQIVKKGMMEHAPELVARDEGYADHPLARLLALSHIAGAKKQEAIRSGKGSWRSQKAWREYYKVKGELEATLRKAEFQAWPYSGHWHGLLIPCTPDCPRYEQCDPKFGPVSS